MPFPFNCCCRAKSNRSELYQAAPDEEETGGGNGKISTGMEMNLTQGTANAPPKYSWLVYLLDFIPQGIKARRTL